MIQLRPYDDLSAMAVIERMDPHDRIEAEIVRGAASTGLALFADWRAMEHIRVASYCAVTSLSRGAMPFALFCMSNCGQAGVAEVSLIARDHRKFRRPLAELGIALRKGLPEFTRNLGIHRLEARAWAGHPSAGRLLEAIGFRHEADMPGFGKSGSVTYRQYAWLLSEISLPRPTFTSRRS